MVSVEAVADERCCGGITANIVICAVASIIKVHAYIPRLHFEHTQATVVAAACLLSSVMEEAIQAIRLKISVPYFPLYTVVPLDLNDRTIQN